MLCNKSKSVSERKQKLFLKKNEPKKKKYGEINQWMVNREGQGIRGNDLCKQRE